MTTNTKIQHTPGPWEARVANEYRPTCYGYTVSSDERPLAEVFKIGLTTEAAEANAHLIAAAPDLLAALEACKEWIDNLVTQGTIDPLLDAMPNNFGGRKTISAAIAKARGEGE